jgi:hypothetical protein
MSGVDPQEYGDLFMIDLSIADQATGRNVQTDHRILGVSDINHCREYGRRFLSGQPFTDTPEGSQARAGTWAHAGILPAVQAQRPGSLIEQEVTVTLPNGFEVLGHLDLAEPDEPSVTDVKTIDGEPATVAKVGSSPQQRSQRHLYGGGAIQAGLVPRDGLIVRNIWLDRSGTPNPPHVEQEPYDPSYLDDAARWVDDVMHHVELGEPAPKDKDYYFCEMFCPFFTACRGGQVGEQPEDIVQSDELAAAAARYREGLEQEKAGVALKKAAADVLKRLEGQKVAVVGEAGTFRYSSTYINPTEVPASSKRGYYRATVKEAS